MILTVAASDKGGSQQETSRMSKRNQTKLTRHGIDQAGARVDPDLADPNRKGMVKSAAAGRATRRLPLGEPPLVITTHAITSFRSSLPEPAGDQPRAGSGSSPSRHGSTTRKSVRRCVECLDRHRYFIHPRGRDQQAIQKNRQRDADERNPSVPVDGLLRICRRDPVIEIDSHHGDSHRPASPGHRADRVGGMMDRREQAPGYTRPTRARVY